MDLLILLCLLDASGKPADPNSNATEELWDVTERALRGGAFLYEPATARAAHRGTHKAMAQQPYVGFRIARTLPD